MSTHLLELKNVNAGYGAFRVLHDINLYVDKGEIVALVGPNGAGKTTTLKTILGLTKLFSGKIFFESKDITKLPTHKRVALGISMVPEGRRVFPSLTVYENLLMGAYLVKNPKDIEDALELVYSLFPILKERRYQKAGTLSGGESQMLAIARALMSKPKILLTDEMSLGLAPKIVVQLFDLVKRLRDEYGITILLVEQHVKQSLEIADRGYVIELGRIILEGAAKELLANEDLRKHYLVV
ncbi:MAG TPA: ABC transporter ATP-binding protein [Acidilobales archaeon]|nr:MAG: branched-chain amino acid ABC transporter ATP-binding protein [Desulfurococcales archaeon ex4484_42]HDD26540.1 ABC transporter ATP-binding protein [Acidilobales archaeon]